jgi:rSAM/selenodomain-associated transferase 1
MSVAARATKLVVMAKAPHAGLAKTRLAPALGAAGAAKLAARMLDHALAQALQAQVGPVELCVTPDRGDAAFDTLAARHAIALTAQGMGDLGARMQRALERGIRQQGQALVMGTDIPQLDAAVLRTAAAALDSHDAVIVPALDGGFVLLGLRRCPDGLLAGLAWSHAGVLAQTLQRLQAHRLTVLQLPALADIDTPDDLHHLPSGWRAARDPAS